MLSVATVGHVGHRPVAPASTKFRTFAVFKIIFFFMLSRSGLWVVPRGPPNSVTSNIQENEHNI